jgi:hypothetical protein
MPHNCPILTHFSRRSVEARKFRMSQPRIALAERVLVADLARVDIGRGCLP